MNKNMNIVLATDNNFVQHCDVAMTSIMEHNKNINFYIITDGLSEKNKKILSDQVNKYNCTLDFLYVDKSIIDKLPMPKSNNLKHISPATYYRLFVAELLPQNIEKLIYLDCDMIIRGDLSDLWNTNLDNYAMAAVYQNNNWATNNHTFDRLNIPYNHGYFNAGMLVINLRYWRDNNIQNKLLNYLHKNYDKIFYHDQDVLNAVLHNQTLYVIPIWNMLTEFYLSHDEDINCGCTVIKSMEMDEYKNNIKIIHFVSRPKPWEYACNHPLCEEYYKYINKTIFKDFRPAFKTKNIWLYHIKPILLKFKRIL